MKNVMIVVMLLSIMLSTACGQKSDVPTKVKTAFNQKFPDATKVSWDKENATEWEAEFKMDGKEYSANFDTDGNWKETEYEISKSDIPSSVKSTLDKDFEAYKIEEAEISETSDGKVYEFELENGENDIEVAISPEGKVIKKEAKEEEDDDENKEEDND